MNKNFKTSLKKGDTVIVRTGKDKGKQGRILKMLPKKSSVLVENVNMMKRHTKQDQKNEGGIVEKEAPIHISNVMFYETVSGKGVRISHKVLEDGRKVRSAAGSGEVLDK
ncbi:MAG: 50S ribosomal protein L24 [Magnetococcales bacterium]|nr:50S ribosomal protein L24 [Magnetococcales bacterium]